MREDRQVLPSMWKCPRFAIFHIVSPADVSTLELAMLLILLCFYIIAFISVRWIEEKFADG